MLDISGILKSCANKTKSLIYPLDYQEIVYEYAGENNLDPALIMAMIKVESNYVVDAHSGKASGLMQITDFTAGWLARRLNIGPDVDLMDPEINIQMGCHYMRYLLDYYNGNLDVALAAYNGGMGNVNKWLADSECSSDGRTLGYIPYKETRDYVKKVNKERERYKELLEEETLAGRFK